MRIGMLAALAIALPGPAIAAPGANALWRNIEAGMPAARVRELYPEVKGSVQHKPNVSIIENVQQVGRCHPDVLVHYAGGIVRDVVVRSRYRGFPKESCGDDAAKALLSKYGAPQNVDQSEQPTGGVITSGLFKGLDTRRNERNVKQVWLLDSVLITFERDDPEIDDAWTITYEAKQDLGL